MQKQYLVVVYDLVDKMTQVTRCKTNEELSTLLLHIDETKYVIVDVSVIDAIQENPKDYCRKEPKLEIGGDQK